MSWDSNLTGEGLSFAASNEPIIKVTAGPGTGKTFSLMRRIWRLLEEEGNPEKIFVGTFTRTAAIDIKTALQELGVDGTDRIKATTIHSFCFGIILSESVLQSEGRSPRPLLDFEVRFLLEDLISNKFGGYYKCRDRLDAFTAYWARLQTEEPGWPSKEIEQQFQSALIGWFRFHQAMHIGELVPLALNHLKNNSDSHYRNFFDFVLVDEYQDLNKSEQVFIDILSESGSLTIIGDADQSIFTQLRFANPQGIQDFSNNNPGTKEFTFNFCRRCPKKIIPLANNLISHNTVRSGTALQEMEENPEGQISIVQWDNMEQEAVGIAGYIKFKIEQEHIDPGKILVLSPRKQFGQAVFKELTDIGVPSLSLFREEELEGKPKIIDESKNQQNFTLLNLLSNKEDIVALRCWCGFGNNSLHKPQWKKLREYIKENGGTPFETLGKLSSGEISIAHTDLIKNRFEKLCEYLESLEGLIGSELIDSIFPENEEWARDLRDLALQHAPENCTPEELYNSVKGVIIQPEIPEDIGVVRIMSIHKSKGLTAKVVLVLGCIKGFIKSGLPENEYQKAIEEQRRLFYVAITRSTETLILSGVKTLPRTLAYTMMVPVYWSSQEIGCTWTSQFIGELGSQRPATISGPNFIESFA